MRFELVDQLFLLRVIVELRHHDLLLRRLRELLVQGAVRLLSWVVALQTALLRRHVMVERLLVGRRTLRRNEAGHSTRRESLLALLVHQRGTLLAAILLLKALHACLEKLLLYGHAAHASGSRLQQGLVRRLIHVV